MSNYGEGNYGEGNYGGKTPKLNPKITKEADGVLYLSCDPIADGYQVFDVNGRPITRTFNPSHVTKLGKVTRWSGGVAPLYLSTGPSEEVHYP